MSATASIEIVGAKEAIKALSKIDKDFRKQFNADAKQIAQPLVSLAGSRYPDTPLSGMNRNWTQGNKKIFPYTKAKAVKGLKVKFSTRRNDANVIYVTQSDAGAVVLETAGRGKTTLLSENLRARTNRILWPAAEQALPSIQGKLRALVLRVIATVNQELK
jgi:mRNA-degrading endonuclease RelE of RelBE toxin-antitoxin system